MRIADISRVHPFGQLLLLWAFVFAGFFIFLLLMMMVGVFFLGVGNINEISSLSNSSSEKAQLFLKWMQGITQIGMMLIPALIFAFFYGKKPFKILKFNKVKSRWGLLAAIVLPFVILPFIGLLSEWNNALHFPEWMASLEQRLRNMEDSAAEMTKIFLQADTVWGMLLNLFIIAIIPAFAEELLFRGVIQNIFKQWFCNVHWAVIVTALIFSIAHGQFFGFLPRFALGLMLGYLFVTAGSIWPAIIAHFVNNGSVVVLSFLQSKNILQTSAEAFGTMENSLFWGLMSAAVTGTIFYFLWKKKREHEAVGA